ncbi:transglutaminase family protein [Luteitalea sp.]|uniref:transglutaminase-like domain-containing protein n=1 Tax=Luteitalea sp. TaxID=2004800 RepID=UPI000A4C9A21|nr:transglutaminase family protein [Luteitalea sp.]
MLIRLGYDIALSFLAPAPVTALLSVHPSRYADLREPDVVTTTPVVPIEQFFDLFGNRMSRFVAPAGEIRLQGRTLIEDTGLPDAVHWGAREIPVERLPPETLRYLLGSRYCEVELLSPIAAELFGHVAPGWARVQAICDWVHTRVSYSFGQSSPTRTALDVFTGRAGVCRDFQHLAITFCRAMHIPARYAAGYLGDIGVPAAPIPMDFSAWFEVYLEDRWWTFDARHNTPRQGRVLMATGLDAADAALTTTYGAATLTHFEVVSDEVPAGAHPFA